MACGGGTGEEWPSLPADLLLTVFALLPSDADRVRFRAVCARWAAAAATWRPRPWLVGSRTDRSGQGAAMSSFWLSQAGGLVPFAAAAVPPGLEYLSSSHGYLALSDPAAAPKAVTLLNPATGRRVPLPPIAFFKRWHDVATLVLSADPAAGAAWAALAAGFPTNCLAYYSSAAPGAWTPLRFSAAGYAGVEHHAGRFYVAFRNRICVLHDPGCGAPPAVIPLEHADPGAVGRSDDEDGPGDGRRVAVDTHLVECGGDLLHVSVRDEAGYSSDDDVAVDGDGSSTDSSGGKRVVELHRVELVGDAAVRLVRVEDLGRHALFLGRNRAFALSKAEFPACRVNCVYLLDRQGHPDGVVRVLGMDSQWARREETIYPDDGRRGSPSAGWARRGWFLPSY
ncbi:uncharacterized protein LOC124706635 [Lolium rigidum]|uniref:uncharacterized protein LOC124706635 n=1 Tax=Lolium rigidum TaxID=89674 RepID=UPI001F5D415D|nr:uncharacterized protein LOC124706635 [Lolium rigidum]